MHLSSLWLSQLLSIMTVIKRMCHGTDWRLRVAWKRGDVTNIATVLHDHRCSETAGSIWNWQLGLGAWLAERVFNWSRVPPIVPVAAWEKKAFEVARAVPRKLCHVVLKSSALIGPNQRLTPISEGYPLWLAKLATPDSSSARSQFSHSPSRVTSTAWTSSHGRRAIPVSLYGNDAENVRSDKDSEPETYGEGIKKEIQYRRTLYLRTILFWGRSPPQWSRQRHHNLTATRADFDSARSHLKSP